MFCDASPIWRFLADLGAVEAPEASRSAASGLFIMEVFPALALASIDPAFFGRLAAPRYNPARRKTFKLKDWKRVATAAAASFADMYLTEAAAWCAEQASLAKPRKADQDRLDAMLCLLIGLTWRPKPRAESIMLGCLEEGYMVSRATLEVRERLTAAAGKYGLRVA
jgi:predicted RNase H-like nuclease